MIDEKFINYRRLGALLRIGDLNIRGTLLRKGASNCDPVYGFRAHPSNEYPEPVNICEAAFFTLDICQESLAVSTA
jgi:hypothetical protein